MKIFLPICFFFVFVATSSAQNDTIFYENFEAFLDSDFGVYPFGDDTTWISFDGDGIPPYSGDPIENSWYISPEFQNAIDPVTGDTNFIANSLSWLEGSVAGNRNWLITPPIYIPDASAVLHWRSATFQLPRYMDGYTVLASPSGSNDAPSGAFKDTLFRAASMQDILSGNGQTIDPSFFSFTPGYLHGNYLNTWSDTSLWQYYVANSDGTLNFGLLEPHSVSLSAYAGKTIYLAFLHDSDDDYYLAIDDVLVRGNTVSVSEKDAVVTNIQSYPNPVNQFINLNFTLVRPAQQVAVTVQSIDGKVLNTSHLGSRATGQYFERFCMDFLAPGSYYLTIQVDDTQTALPFVKR